jgi:hypothetical protein
VVGIEQQPDRAEQEKQAREGDSGQTEAALARGARGIVRRGGGKREGGCERRRGENWPAARSGIRRAAGGRELGVEPGEMRGDEGALAAEFVKAVGHGRRCLQRRGERATKNAAVAGCV